MSDWPELSKLAEAISLGDGFAFYVLIVPSEEDAALALSALRKEVELLSGESVAYESVRPLLAAESPKTETETALAALLSPRADAQYVVLDLSETRDFSEGPLGHLFFRLNEQRNRLVEQVNRPLILVIPPFAERLLVDTAQDLWSIRSLPAVLLPVDTLRHRMPGLASASEPARDTHPPVSILIIAPTVEREVVHDIGYMLDELMATGVIRIEWTAPFSRLTPNEMLDSLVHPFDVLVLVGVNDPDWPNRVPFVTDLLRSKRQSVLIGDAPMIRRLLKPRWPVGATNETVFVRVAERSRIAGSSYWIASLLESKQAILAAVNRCRVQRGQPPLVTPLGD